MARWLLVDEAAALLLPLLHQLMGYFSHVLLTTTGAGYEGTGHGFLLKFCDVLLCWHPLVLRCAAALVDKRSSGALADADIVAGGC